jgi:transposase
MECQMQHSIGIDIAKKSFQADIDGKLHEFANDASGSEALIALTDAASIFIIEATGNYSWRLAESLHAAERRVKIINPLSARRFAQLRLKRSKTDRIDARLLSEYGAIAQEAEFAPLSDESNRARQHQTVIEQLQKQRTALRNQLEAILQLPRPAQEVIDALEKSITQLDETIKQLRVSMRAHVELAHPGMMQRIETIPGIGRCISAALVTATDGFRQFHRAKQVVAYLGACPTQYESGTSVQGRGSISRIGSHTIRTQMYMGAMAAVRSDNEFGRYYRHLLQRGKAPKVALMAVINKMLRVAFALATKNLEYDDKKPTD